jgi:hypothetical protein
MTQCLLWKDKHFFLLEHGLPHPLVNLCGNLFYQTAAALAAAGQKAGEEAPVPKSSNPRYNQRGITPSIGLPVSGSAQSVTQSAIAEGTVETRGNRAQDISGLSRDTGNALNTLGKIFDKAKVEERMELIKVFGEVAAAQIHIIKDKKGWDDNSAESVALHALLGGIMAKLGGGGTLPGAVSGGLNEAVMGELEKIEDPALRQWASAAIGAAVGALLNGNAQAGASIAASGTKYNELLTREEIIGIFNQNMTIEKIIEINAARGVTLTEEEANAIQMAANELARYIYLSDGIDQVDDHIKNADAILITLNAGYFIGGSVGLLIDLQTQKVYRVGGLSGGFGILPADGQVALVRITPQNEHIDIKNDLDAREKAMDGYSLGASVGAGIFVQGSFSEGHEYKYEAVGIMTNASAGISGGGSTKATLTEEELEKLEIPIDAMP